MRRPRAWATVTIVAFGDEVLTTTADGVTRGVLHLLFNACLLHVGPGLLLGYFLKL